MVAVDSEPVIGDDLDALPQVLSFTFAQSTTKVKKTAPIGDPIPINYLQSLGVSG